MQSVSSNAVANAIKDYDPDKYVHLTAPIYQFPFLIFTLTPYQMYQISGASGKTLIVDLWVYNSVSSLSIQIAWGYTDGNLQQSAGYGRVGFQLISENTTPYETWGSFRRYKYNLSIPSGSDIVCISSNYTCFLHDFHVQ